MNITNKTNKRAQEENLQLHKEVSNLHFSWIKKRNKAQEEMVGFALIMIIVVVILMIFLGLSLKNKNKAIVESYEAESFINAILDYTTDCRDSSNLEYLSIKKLIFECYNNEKCLDNRQTCDVLRTTLSEIVQESWIIDTTESIGERHVESPIKGYLVNITANNEEFLSIEQGTKTSSSKGSMQDLGKNRISMQFSVYY